MIWISTCAAGPDPLATTIPITGTVMERTKELRARAVAMGAVAAVGGLDKIVPDHWVPIILIARQRRRSTELPAFLRAIPCSRRARQSHIVIDKRVAWAAQESVSVVAGGVVPARYGGPTHARLHHHCR
jgi:hypothetical protein